MNEFIMNYDKSITVVLFLFLIALVFGGGYVIAKLLVWYGKLQAKLAREYELKYSIVEMIIDTHSVCDQNFDWIEKMFDNLLECKYKNPEMTEVLYNKFREKYEDIAKKRVSEDS